MVKKIRVLLVAPAYPLVGGQAVQAQRLLAKFEEVEEIEMGFLPVNPSFFPALQRVRYFRTILTTFRYIISLLITIPRYDVIHVFSASFFSFVLAPGPAILIAKLFGKKVLLNYRSGFAEEHFQEWPRTSVPLIKRCDSVVTPSGYLVDVFAQFGITAVSVANFVSNEKFVFRERNPLQPKFLSNRNFEDLYNVACTIDAFERIQNEYPEASLIVAGGGPLEQTLREKVESKGLRHTEFVGQVPQKEMPGLYERSDIYLNSPNIDNMPNSILEAFASGTPVVSTNAGGIPYIVEHEQNGLLVDIGDDAALAEQALRLLRDPMLADKVITGAKSDLEKYSWETVREDWIDVYRTI